MNSGLVLCNRAGRLFRVYFPHLTLQDARAEARFRYTNGWDRLAFQVGWVGADAEQARDELLRMMDDGA